PAAVAHLATAAPPLPEPSQWRAAAPTRPPTLAREWRCARPVRRPQPRPPTAPAAPPRPRAAALPVKVRRRRAPAGAGQARSEERRVGKECRARWTILRK